MRSILPLAPESSEAYLAVDDPLLLAPIGVFVLVSVAQLAIGLVTLRRGGWLTTGAGAAGTAFGALTAITVYGSAEGLAGGVPQPVPWYGLLVVVATALSVGAAFRLWAKAYAIVPVLTGLVFLTWFYGWFV